MSANLTDRGIKLLYGQRGSRSRQVVHEGDDDRLIIRGPIIEQQSDVEESPREQFEDEPLLDGPFVEPEHEEQEPLHEERHNEYQFDNEKVEQPVVHENFDEEELLSYYNFQDMPLRQLSSSITSVTSIDVLISMFTNLFENDLIPQAIKEFESSKDSNSKMMYKLDVRIFESVLEQLIKDFKDILDINMSNNELCYQLKQIVVAREELNQELVETRSELQKLKCGGEWYKVQQEQSELNGRVELNDQLNHLNAQLHGEAAIPTSQEPLATNETVSDFCEMVNPYSGILARLEQMNNSLQQEHSVE